MADEAVYGISKRGEKTLIYRGFEFWQHRTKADGHIIWRCNKNCVCKCKATIEASGIQVVGTRVVEHNPEGNVATPLARRAVGKMKAAVLNTLSNPSTVRAAVSSQLPDHFQKDQVSAGCCVDIGKRHWHLVTTRMLFLRLLLT